MIYHGTIRKEITNKTNPSKNQSSHRYWTWGVWKRDVLPTDLLEKPCLLLYLLYLFIIISISLGSISSPIYPKQRGFCFHCSFVRWWNSLREKKLPVFTKPLWSLPRWVLAGFEKTRIKMKIQGFKMKVRTHTSYILSMVVSGSLNRW